MSKIYRRKTGLIVLSGEVVSLNNNGTEYEVGISVSEYNNQTGWTEKVVTAKTTAIGDSVSVGSVATAIGYQAGMNTILAQTVTSDPSLRYVEDVEVVSGPVHKAEFKSETNDDGTPKLKRDGTPRKPHFDVTIKVMDEENHSVNHRIKIYNYKEINQGDKTEIEKAQRAFYNFVDKDETPVIATIVTKPGNPSSWESEYNGKVYQNFASDHMGKMSWDLNWIGEDGHVIKKQNQTQPAHTNVAPAQPNQPVPTNTAPVQQTAQPTQAPQQPQMYGAGNSSYVVEDDTYL